MIFKQYIDGSAVDGSGSMIRIVSPATEEEAGRFQSCGSYDAQQALLAAESAFPMWSSLSVESRNRWINKLREAVLERKEEILDVLMAETGKPLPAAEYDFGMLIQCLEYYPEEVKRKNGSIINDYHNGFANLITHEPLGVVVCYLAWNFPLLNVGYKLGPSLASGCTCVIKPSTKTPLATMMIGETARMIGFPAGVFNIIAGSHNEISHVLNTSDIPRMITIIGSSRSGREIVRESATSIKRYSLELGGNAPAIIMADANVAEAAQYIANMKFDNAGQICVAPNRVFVHESVHGELISALKKCAEKTVLGWGRQPEANMGPMITRRDRDRMSELVRDAVEKGAVVVAGGKPVEGKGFFFQPTVLESVTKEMDVYRQEIFGPIIAVKSFTDSDDIAAMANDSNYGLAAYLYARNIADISLLSKKLMFGTVCVNEPLFAINLPHGGVKESGIGKDCSSYSLDDYYYIKRTSIRMR